MALSMKSLCFLARNTLRISLSQRSISTSQIQKKKHHVLPLKRELYRRRLEVGPEPERHRSEWSNWNFEAEVFSFGKRLGEEFEESTLRTALTHRSYVEREEGKRKEFGTETFLDIADNSMLMEKGTNFMKNYILSNLRCQFPNLPEEGITGVCDHLLSVGVLSHVSSHLGTSDIILCNEFPVSDETLASTLKAIVGALLEDQGDERTKAFIEDFIIAELIGQDVNEMWEVMNPMGILMEILEKQGRGTPESRLLRQAGRNTVEAVYEVGIYSDKKMLGRAHGETVLLAEEEAARDALRNIFDTQDNRRPLILGKFRERLYMQNRATESSTRTFVI